MQALRSVPEQGQLAVVRQRRYVVTDVRRGATGAQIAEQPQHLVSLTSIEDDALGEELQVIWEIEPGARAFEKMELPEPKGFDQPAHLEAFLDAVRWGAASIADTRQLQSPFRSGIEIESYQLDPVVRAIQMPRVNLLIADDVGLGKTIESGMVVLELMLRHRANRVLVVCPSSLQIKWRDEMLEKFGLDFAIVDSALIKRLRRERGLYANPWTHFPRLITSMDYLKREYPLRMFREAVAHDGARPGLRDFDILIVDEAHNAAPSGTGNFALDSQRTQALREIGKHFEHKLFLTATPHNGYKESFSALLELLDDQRFARSVAPEPAQLRAVMVRRLKSEIKNWDGSDKFPRRTLEHIPVDYTAEEQRIHALLTQYARIRAEGYRDNSERFATEFVLKLLKKRLFSSPQAFLNTLNRHRASLRRSARYETLTRSTGALARIFEQAEEDYSDDAEQQEAELEALEAAARAFRPPSAADTQILNDLAGWAERAAAQLDSKADKLVKWLESVVRPSGHWNQERVIIFTEYRDTQKWLHDHLATRGFKEGDRLELLYGAQDTDDRERIKAAFQFDPKDSPIRILLATDAASEGIDLQRHCHRLIHYEIPWNPNRLEQRNGRIDRHGQRAPEVKVYHFVASGFREETEFAEGSGASLAADLEFLYRAAKKVQQIREDLGKVGPVIAEQVEEAMLGKRRRLDTARAERENEPVKRLLRFEQNIRELSRRHADQLDETRRDLHLTPANIEAVVHIALDLARQPRLIPATLEGIPHAFAVPRFADPSWQPCLTGLIHPHTGLQRPITFDPEAAAGRDDIVLAHLNHRLVQRCLRLLRAEVWAPTDRQKIHRVTVRTVPRAALRAPAVLAHARLTVVSSDSHRLHEEVIAAGGIIQEGRLERWNVTQTAEVLAAAGNTQPPDSIRQRLAELWPRLTKSLLAALDARGRDRTDSIRKQLADRAEDETGKITATLLELEAAIRTEIGREPDQQLSLFTDAEREQEQRNRDFLAARLAELPAELARETEAIHRRYSDPQPRLFPVAVTFLVPEGLAEMSAASEYAELLKLIEVSGPFISLPVFREVFPQGLVKDAPDLTRELRELYTEWRAARDLAPHTVSPAQRDWLRAVLLTLLEWPADLLAEDNAIPQNLSYFVAQHHETLRPDSVLLDDGKPRLLVNLLPPAQQPDRRPPSTTWNATCAARMAELLHATHVPLGLVTNGERFTLVYAEPGQPTGFADFHAELWFDERLTLRAFRDFLSAGALFNRPPEQTLDALYRRSLENQQEVSTTLGRQVRRAVEMFVTALDRADRESGRALLQGLPGEHIYEAALTLMMRLVFLFFAEERDLLPITNPVYRENYAVSTLHDQLREAADRLGEEVLERRYDAFPRLLAGFRAVHGGIAHDLAALPAYGGDLFDPDRFPFLEGRAPGSGWRSTSAQPCPIHNRTVLHLLGALQFLEMKVPGGGRESRRLSFRALDIEQIGHVYEGLLDHTARRATEIVLGLDGKEELEVELSELNRRRAQPDFIAWLADETGRTAKAIEKALAQTTVDDPLRWPEWEQVAFFASLVRRDDNGDPWVIPTGSLYVTAGTARRQTGTQYTPRTLTESVVEHALAPLVYTGPAEGQPPEAWQLKPSGQILDLKICDFACGSAAFLVAAARYLSARLVEAWDAAQREHGPSVQITPYGHPSSGLPEEELIPSNPDERSIYALRIVVERCLYGVDRNPLAVEMAKLSLWLLTLQRNRPFTFLDHAIRCGDSLLGVTRRDQIETFGFSPQEHEVKQITLWRKASKVLFERALEYRLKLESFPVLTASDVERKQALLRQAEEATVMTRLMCDILVGAALFTTTGKPPQEDEAFSRKRGELWRQLMETYRYDEDVDSWRSALEAMRPIARKLLDAGLLLGSSPHRTFHWPLEFPEVFVNRDGFDAIVGNPPFMGGQRITGAFGQPYRDYLVEYIAGGRRGSADYVAYFFLRAEGLLKSAGSAGLLATNTLAQGDTREVGLDQLTAHGATVYRALPSRKWPGEANLEVAHVWFRKGGWAGPCLLDDVVVAGITSQLQAPGTVSGRPYRLAANAGKSFQGSIVLGMGFVLEPEEAQRLLDKESRNRDVLFPYLNGEDLNRRSDQSPSRWVINFHDWPLEKAMEYPDCFEIVARLVKPEREKNNRKVYRDKWWQYGEKRPELYATIAGLDRALVIPETTKYCAFSLCPTGIVFSHMTKLIALGDTASAAIVMSSIHEAWARTYSSTLETRLKYITSDGFETFPFPTSLDRLESIGERYHSHRRDIMIARREGLTATYNRFHSAHEVSHDIATLRALHVEMDHAVAAAYGWTDLDLGHGFHETKQGLRYTISEAARRTVLDLLLALNHERYAAEQSAASAAPRPKAKARKRAPEQAGLF